MEKRIEALEQKLDFTEGQLQLLKYVTATFIGGSPGASAFVATLVPKIAESLELACRENRTSQAYVDGVHHAQETVSDIASGAAVHFEQRE